MCTIYWLLIYCQNMYWYCNMKFSRYTKIMKLKVFFILVQMYFVFVIFYLHKPQQYIERCSHAEATPEPCDSLGLVWARDGLREATHFFCPKGWMGWRQTCGKPCASMFPSSRSNKEGFCYGAWGIIWAGGEPLFLPGELEKDFPQILHLKISIWKILKDCH